MKIAVLSDIHANLEALEAVLVAVRAAGVDRLVCLGDVVGYGPDPEACVEIVRREATAWVQGNHDLAVLPEHRGLRDAFRHDAALAVEWTESRLDGGSMEVLRSLPTRLAGPWGWAAHGSLDDPMEYVFTAGAADIELDRAETLDVGDAGGSAHPAMVWLGHTHLPMCVHRAPPGELGRSAARSIEVDYGEAFPLTPGSWLINPGSVGQPRDADPRARWGMLDTGVGRVTVFAVEYDYRTTQRKMVAAGLPAGLVQMLGP